MIVDVICYVLILLVWTVVRETLLDIRYANREKYSDVYDFLIVVGCAVSTVGLLFVIG